MPKHKHATKDTHHRPLTAMVQAAMDAGKKDVGDIIEWVKKKHGITLQRPFVHVIKESITKPG